MTRHSSRAKAVSASMVEEAKVEAEVEVREAGTKGMGAFAAAPLAAGAYVGTYQGTLSTREEFEQRYVDFDESTNERPSDYCFLVDESRNYSIDARNSTHFSKYINHAQRGNLEVKVDSGQLRIDFFGTRRLKPCTELLASDHGAVRFLACSMSRADSWCCGRCRRCGAHI